MDPRTPVVVGVGQVTNRRERIAHPLDLMQDACLRAQTDSGGRALEAVDSLQFIQLISWRSPAPATILGETLKLDLKERFVSTVGGSTPQALMNSACERITSGEISGALIVGCEAMDSMRRAQKEGIDYDVKNLTAVWNATNDQDRALVEFSQRGATSSAYEPGPYSPFTEGLVEKFSAWYIGRLAEQTGA